jgi:hypothetical protein
VPGIFRGGFDSANIHPPKPSGKSPFNWSNISSDSTNI